MYLLESVYIDIITSGFLLINQNIHTVVKKKKKKASADPEIFWKAAN